MQHRSPSDSGSSQVPTTLGSARSPALGPSNSRASAYGITLVSQDTVVAEMTAFDQTSYVEWLDGLNLLLPGGFIATKETAELVQTLTEIGIKIRLLDLTGERLEIPTVIPTPIVPPATVPFYYSE